ncbi:hypothetical protein [Saccharothrix syringae]|uniref:Uncharacterized protein n=1 Tax=Saccharothrix syringae TaxID=103733 RepID=A0A5Q0H819_SACSY|nr:hypothetical protein [Saccharothrix syringae]QFZ22123.1 hypothetical protein EKG83_36150 [Saccharothrix syringae]
MVVRVRGVEHAKQLREELEHERVAGYVVPPEVGRPTGAGAAGVVAEGGDLIEMDLPAFTAAVSDLDRLHAVLTDLLGRADRELDQPLGDGRGPVALHMRRAFGLRGGDLSGGVRHALRSYLDELEAVRASLQGVRDAQQAQDQQVGQALGRA